MSETQVQKVVIEDYSSRWPKLFEELRGLLWPVVGDFALAIEHVGSTSVPDLAAKPIVDLDIVIPSPDWLAVAIGRLAGLGYVHQGDLGIAGRDAFRDPPGSRRHNLYVCPAGSPALANHLSFRDRLRADPEATARYAELKRRLAREFPFDRDAYTEGKSSFILTLLG